MAALPLRQMCLEKALTYLKTKIEVHNPHHIISALSFKVAFNMLNLHLQQVQIDLHFFHFSLQSESTFTHVTLYKFDCKAVESSSLTFKFLTAMNTDLKI
ncbi:hypothetical protein CEXT_641731 [Caerostris extrusa]|uniref:Uncharacterized protein n=1 Tax=Caerostris extrusa TaxID=172846 RepID=A0AAV4VJZ4_CAEEX|nr:hypothetical protein CEXT_641731 [Caerostris extrusa]